MGTKDGWRNDFWLDLSNSYLWNTDANKDILGEHSFPFPIFVATAYQSKNRNEFVPIENTPLYCGVPVDPRKLGIKTDLGGGFVQVSFRKGALSNFLVSHKDHLQIRHCIIHRVLH